MEFRIETDVVVALFGNRKKVYHPPNEGTALENYF